MPTLFDPTARTAILDRISRLTPDRRPVWGRFTAPEMVCHISCDLRHGLGELETDPPSGPLTNFPLNWLAIHVIPWPRGKGKSPPEFLATRPTTWAAALSRLRDLLQRLGARGPVAKDYDQAMQELTPLGFSSLGDVGEQRKDGSLAVSRWFGHSGGTISGWLGFITTKRGPRLLAFLVTEASGPIYCTSLRGGTGLSLARPPHVSHADYELSMSLVEMVGGHRERLSSFTTERMQLTGVATLDEAIELMERLHQARMTWRASVGEDELLRADLRSVLANSYRKMAAEDFWLIYSHAAEWLDFHPARAPEPSAPLGSARADVRASTQTGPEVEQGALGAESDWLFHW